MDIQKVRTLIIAEADKRGLTTAQLAKKSRVNYLTVQTVLDGTRKPQRKTLTRLARTLKIELDGNASEAQLPKRKSAPQYAKALNGDLTPGQAEFIRHSLRLSRRGQ